MKRTKEVLNAEEERLLRAVAEAAVGWRRSGIAFAENSRLKGSSHEDTEWAWRKLDAARQRLERATDEYEVYCLDKYGRDNAEHYRKLAAEARG